MRGRERKYKIIPRDVITVHHHTPEVWGEGLTLMVENATVYELVQFNIASGDWVGC